MTTCRHGIDSKEANCSNCANTKRRKNSLRIRKHIAPFINFLVPCFGLSSWSGCHSCGISVHVVPFHTVWHSEGNGCSIICEACWRDINEEEKLKIYKRRWEEGIDSRHSWEEIHKSIVYPLYWENKTGFRLRLLEEE